MDKRATILRCLYENWRHEVSMIGVPLVTRIVDDALEQRRTNFWAPQGGDHFDLTPYITTIIDVALLLAALTQVIEMWPRSSTGQPADVTPDIPPHEPDDRTEGDKDARARILVQLVAHVINVEKAGPGKATEVVSTFLRAINNDH